MRPFASLFLAALITVTAAYSQVELVSEHNFPPEHEFKELQKVLSEESFENESRLSKIKDGDLIAAVGFDRYERRSYLIEGKNTLSIEVFSLTDSLAAYSLLTLLRESDIHSGPPGDAFTTTADGIRFAQGRKWIRIQSSLASQDLLKRIALSVSRRIGPSTSKVPSLISHLPKTGIDISSLRFFPGLKPYQLYARRAAGLYLNLDTDVAIAEAQYRYDNHAGILTLLNFPTTPAAEDYFESPEALQSVERAESGIYSKRAGPLVAVLAGNFDPSDADKILSTLKYSYAIRWVYNGKNQPKTIWGVPTKILGTVVNSLFFVALLCVVSMIIGLGVAVFRFIRHGRVSQKSNSQTEQDEIMRLRLQ